MHLLDYIFFSISAIFSQIWPPTTVTIWYCAVHWMAFLSNVRLHLLQIWCDSIIYNDICELADHAWSSGHKMVGNSVTLSSTSWACLLARRLMLQPLSMPSIAPLHRGLMILLRWWRPEDLSSTHQYTNIYWHPKRIDWQQSHHFQRNQTQA